MVYWRNAVNKCQSLKSTSRAKGLKSKSHLEALTSAPFVMYSWRSRLSRVRCNGHRCARKILDEVSLQRWSLQCRWRERPANSFPACIFLIHIHHFAWENEARLHQFKTSAFTWHLLVGPFAWNGKSWREVKWSEVSNKSFSNFLITYNFFTSLLLLKNFFISSLLLL